MDAEGVVGAAGAGAPPVGGEAPGGEAVAAADGVQHLLCGVDPGAVPGGADEPSDHLPAVVVEPVAGCVPAVGGALAVVAVVSGEAFLKSESGCSDAVWAPNRREAVV